MVDSKNLHFLEDWQPIPNQKGTTRYLELMNTFQLRILTSSRKIGTKIEKEREREREILPSNHRKRIKESFVESLCFLFDGILNGAMASPQLNNRRPSRVSASRVLTVRDIVCLPLPLLLPFPSSYLHPVSSYHHITSRYSSLYPGNKIISNPIQIPHPKRINPPIPPLGSLKTIRRRPLK
jgi:hypothetical protein